MPYTDARRRLSVLLVAASLGACSSAASATPAASALPQQQAGRGGGGGGSGSDGPRPYEEVITDAAVTQRGMFDVHEVDDAIYFEIPAAELGREMLLVQRAVESTLQQASAFFGGGPRLIVQWELDGEHVVLREKEYDLIADEGDAIWRQVSGFRKGPVLRRFEVEAFGPGGSAVIDVSDLFISNIPELGPIEGLAQNRSWVERTWSFDDRVNVQVTQSGQARGANGGGRGCSSAWRGSPTRR